MSYKNTMKLFASNFNFVWKQLVYFIGCLLLLAVCSYTTITPIIDLLKENGIGYEFQKLFDSFYAMPNEIGLMISDIFKKILVIIINNFSQIYLSLLFAIVLCLVMPFILFEMSTYNLASIAYQKFTMNKTSSYLQNAISTFKPSLKYAFANIILTLPFTLINLALLFLYLIFAKTILSALIGLIILSALTILLQGIKIAIFSHYTGLVISEPQSLFKAFAKSLAIVFKDFWKNFSNSIILHLTIIFVNSFLMVFTFFAGLIISIPATFVLVSFFYIVSYLSTIGQRYYLSDTIIYNPVEYVVKKDDFVTISIPEVEKEVQVTTTKIKKIYKKHNSKK